MKVYKDNLDIVFEIDESVAGQSIRTFLQSYYLSKKIIHELYMSKTVTLNEQVQNFECRLQVGDQLRIPVHQTESIDFIPQKMNLDIVYEDDHLLILNKPAGIMVHPDHKNGKNTLVNGVAYYYEQTNQHHRVRYIHRLDTDTSGGIIFVKHFLAHSLLDQWLANKEIKRFYLALVHGNFKINKGIIDAAIGKDRHHNQRRRVTKNGDSAVTYYNVQKNMKTYSLVKLELKTGRTHQIRVHMSHIGHPLLGDELYGGAKTFQQLKRQALHSYEIKMIHPMTKQVLELHIPLPKDMVDLIK